MQSVHWHPAVCYKSIVIASNTQTSAILDVVSLVQNNTLKLGLKPAVKEAHQMLQLADHKNHISSTPSLNGRSTLQMVPSAMPRRRASSTQHENVCLPFHCVLFGNLVLDANSADSPPASSNSVAWSLKNDVEVHAYSNNLFNASLCRQAVALAL